MSDKNFLKSIFELIERYAEDEIFFTAAIKLILAFNLRFDYSQENPIMLMLSGVDQEIMYRTFFERLILLFNRGSKNFRIVALNKTFCIVNIHS